MSEITAKYLFDTYAQESYQNSFDHGFWDEKENRNKEEMVMLMISELGECQEAYRSGKHNPCILSFEDTILPEYHNDPQVIAAWYRNSVKGCTGEELADVMIRIFDYVVGWGLSYNGGRYIYASSGNFSADLLKLVLLIHRAEETWDSAISAVFQFSQDWNIDLDYHIHSKQRYNRTRPYRHGKKF